MPLMNTSQGVAHAAFAEPTAQQKFECAMQRMDVTAAQNPAQVSAFFKAACAAYQDATYTTRSFTFLGKHFGSNHQQQVARWVTHFHTVTMEDVDTYVSSYTGHFNPEGDFCKTVMRAFEKVRSLRESQAAVVPVAALTGPQY